MFLKKENGDENKVPLEDQRIYVPLHDGWDAKVKSNSIKEYCYYKTPGDDYFHPLMLGEIYLLRGDEKCCLNCAIRHGITTQNRMHWQHRDSLNKP